MKTILLDDGYNGHKIECFAKVLDKSENAVRLRVAEPGKEYMFKWCWKDEYKRMVKDNA